MVSAIQGGNPNIVGNESADSTADDVEPDIPTYRSKMAANWNAGSIFLMSLLHFSFAAKMLPEMPTILSKESKLCERDEKSDNL